MRILAATDFSTRSQRALRRAGLLARTHGAELVLVHVAEDDQPTALVERDRREAERFLGEQLDAVAQLRGLRSSALVVAGDAFDGILRAADRCSADLIVMGAHRKQLLRDIFIGTTIERVIRTGPYPVLMVNTEAAHPYGRLMAATDLSEASAHAIRTAQALGLVDAASLTLVHGFSPMVRGIAFTGAGAEQIDAYLAEERAEAGSELMAFLQAQGWTDNRWIHRITEAPAIVAITEAVQVIAPDLVVIGTRGRSALTRALLGSVTERVLRSLDVDILAVPPPR